MKRITVQLKENRYDIVVGRNILPRLGNYLRDRKIFSAGTVVVIITNRLIHRLHGTVVRNALRRAGFSVEIIEVKDSEKSKSFAVAQEVIKKVALCGAKRKVGIVALGGGVIGDLAGFVAAVYRRGVPYVQVPTTFLAQIDSAIGGKVAIDLPVGKNLVGAFYQPKLVWTDVTVLKTLAKRQISSGLAEAIKYGVIRDVGLFSFLERNFEKLMRQETNALEHVIHKCSAIKAEVVRQDEKETKGIRTILNFGHTVGHALETVTGYKGYAHGEAVAIGMCVAADISARLGLAQNSSTCRLESLIARVGLPTRFRKISIPALEKAMGQDKKFITGKNRFVLLRRIGKVQVLEGIPPDVIRRAVLGRFKKP